MEFSVISTTGSVINVLSGIEIYWWNSHDDIFESEDIFACKTDQITETKEYGTNCSSDYLNDTVVFEQSDLIYIYIM